jgi:uncharacterized Tic20 family protein
MKRYPPEAAARRDQPVAHTHHEVDAAGRPAPGEQLSWQPVAARSGSEELLAAAGYLGVIFFLFVPPLVIYLARRRSSDYLRYHAARAVNVAVTIILFDLSAAIVGAMLSLDAVTVGLAVAVPLATVVWLVIVVSLVRSALAAARGEPYELPDWLCVRALRQALAAGLTPSGRGSPRPRAAARPA